MALSKLTYVAGKSEEILSLSFAKEKDAKEVVSQQNHVGEDESGYEVFFTSGVWFLHQCVINSSTNDKLEREGRGERERERKRRREGGERGGKEGGGERERERGRERSNTKNRE